MLTFNCHFYGQQNCFLWYFYDLDESWILGICQSQNSVSHPRIVRSLVQHFFFSLYYIEMWKWKHEISSLAPTLQQLNNFNQILSGSVSSNLTGCVGFLPVKTLYCGYWSIVEVQFKYVQCWIDMIFQRWQVRSYGHQWEMSCYLAHNYHNYLTHWILTTFNVFLVVFLTKFL